MKKSISTSHLALPSTAAARKAWKPIQDGEVARGARILVESLRREGVEVAFGYPGGAILPTFDEIYDCDIQFILVRHEQGAAHMADGYARATGKPGVCIATSGPGATNLVTGIATAFMDSIPMIAITGQVKTFLIGNDAFQEADVVGVTRPITKHNFLVKDVKDLARIIREAFYIASTGRPGPVLIDVPVDVQQAKTAFAWPTQVRIRGYKPPRPEGHMGQVKKAAEAIMNSKRPVLYVGGGAVLSNASEEVRQLVRRAHIPCTTTVMALGTYPEQDSSYALRMLGMHGTQYANKAVQESDLLISVGARFDDRVTGKLDAFAPKAKIVHIDTDPSSISKNVKVDIPIVGNAKDVLQHMLKYITRPADSDAWLKQVDEWRKKFPFHYKNDTSEIRSQFVIQEISRLTKGNAVVTTGVGQHQMWAAQWYGFNKPRSFITSGGLGTMGFGFPAAIGAQLGRRQETVFVIDGDGSFQMTMFELPTVAQYKIPVKIAVLDNQYLGMVRQWQELFYERRYSASDFVEKNPDFVMLAEACGVPGFRAEKKQEVAPIIEKALKIDGPVMLHFKVVKEDNVYPMVPAGAAIHEMIDGMS